MKTRDYIPKLITYAVCVAAMTLGVTAIMLFFHCPIGWKAVLWVGMAAVSLLLLWPVKRYTQIIPVLTASCLTASLLFCTYVEPYFIKEALASEGSPSANGNVWLVVWVLLAVGLFYLMTHMITRMMDHLSPNESVFDSDEPSSKATSPKHPFILPTVLAVLVIAAGIFSGVIYHKNVAAIPTSAPHSEADYTVVMPNLYGELSDDVTNTVGYGAYQVHYQALEGIPVNEFVHAKQSANGHALQVSVLLRHQDHAFDPARDADIQSITFTKSTWELYGNPPRSLSEADEALITAILRGEVTATPAEVTDPEIYGTVKITFFGYEYLWWEGKVVRKGEHYYLRVATNTDFSVKDARYDPKYAFYPLDASDLAFK